MSDYDPLLVEAAAKYNVPIAELRALIKLETNNGLYNRTSPKGAQGLMQLMPATARAMGVNDINDPRQNIFGGAKYYAQQRTRLGSPGLAAAAYNAGPGAVAKAGGIPNFKETRNYVANFLKLIQSPAASPAPTPALAAAPIGPRMADPNADDGTEAPSDFSAMPAQYQAYMARADANAARREAVRKQQFDAGNAMLAKAYAGPSRSQQLFALSQAFLQPTRTGGGRFAQVLNNVVGALGSTNEQMQEAQQKRAMAAMQLNNTYANQGLEGDDAALERDFKLWQLMAKGGNGQYSLGQDGRWHLKPGTGGSPVVNAKGQYVVRTPAEAAAVPSGAPFVYVNDPTNVLTGR